MAQDRANLERSMDIPCAILIAAFCLPDSNFKLEVKARPDGAVAIVTSGEVRANILLSDEGGSPPTQMVRRLCYEGACVDYSTRFRDEESSIELLIAGERGRERFIQLRGPLQPVTDFSAQMSYVVDTRDGFVRIPLSEFLTVVDEPVVYPPWPER